MENDQQMELELELDAELARALNSPSEETSAFGDLLPRKDDDNLVADEEFDRFAASPRENSIFLFGVDDMSTNDIQKYVNSSDMKIEWINDSSCNLVFENSEYAHEALSKIIVDASTLEHITHTTLLPARSFIDGDRKFDLLFVRISTDEDVKGRNARQESRYYMIHGIEDPNISEDRKGARREHQERMRKNGGDGRDVFSRLGKKTEQRRSRSSSRSPTRNQFRSNERKRSVERELPAHLRDRLGPAKNGDLREVIQTAKEDNDANST